MHMKFSKFHNYTIRLLWISLGVYSGENRPYYSRKQTKEGKPMNCHANKCVECTVQECANHCTGENYCTLDKILVGTHESNPTVDQCTDCKSFRRK